MKVPFLMPLMESPDIECALKYNCYLRYVVATINYPGTGLDGVSGRVLTK